MCGPHAISGANVYDRLASADADGGATGNAFSAGRGSTHPLADGIGVDGWAHTDRSGRDGVAPHRYDANDRTDPQLNSGCLTQLDTDTQSHA